MNFKINKAITSIGDEKKRYFRRIGIEIDRNPYMELAELLKILKLNDIEVIEQNKKYIKIKQDRITYIIFQAPPYKENKYNWLDLRPILDLELLCSFDDAGRERYVNQVMFWWVSLGSFGPATGEYALQYFGIELQKVSDEEYILKQNGQKYTASVVETFYPFETIKCFASIKPIN